MKLRLPRINIAISTQKNALGDNLGRDFLVNGPRFAELPDWGQTIMSDPDKYTGYMFAAIQRRVNKVSQLAEENLKTDANDSTSKAAKDKKVDLLHPYLTIIDESPTFANDQFWREIQTYIDLKGDYYLMVIRGGLGSKVGDVKEFKLLNPYNITVVRDLSTMEIIGYTEIRGTQYREVPPHMIIPIKPLNPFDPTKPWAMTDAARDAQFTLKETSQQMRSATKRNRKYPGIILLGGEGVALDPKQTENFKNRMRGKGEGSPDEPMLSTATTVKGGISWNDMQVDLRKSAVDLVNEINLNAMIAVTGVSKTKLGIEQSGVTRDTAAIQDDLFVLDQGMPALQLIINALNQDYKTNYPNEYKKTGYKMRIENPLKEDKDAELTDVMNRTNTFDLYTAMLEQGYDSDTAAAYASGNKELEDIGEPTNKPEVPATADPVIPPAKPAQNPKLEPPISAKSSLLLNQIAARDIPGLYEGTGVDPDDLGCIMLNSEPMKITSLVKDGDKDLVDSSSRHDHQMAAVAETEPHITLLYGLLENGNVWKNKVDSVLDGWNMKTAKIEKIGSFDTPDGTAIVAHIEKTPALVDGHERLTLLPHINTFSEYKPHMTLAYISKDANTSKWVKALGDAYNGKRVKVTGINYGDPADGRSSNAAHVHQHDDALPVVRNQLDPATQTILTQQTASLKNAVINVEHQIVTAVLNKVTKNAFDNQGDIIDDAQRKADEQQLELALATFYGIVIQLNAASVMSRRLSEFGKSGDFKVDDLVNAYIRVTAERAASSHINTVLDDILDTIKTTEERLVQGELKLITPKPGQSPEEVLQLARTKALDGAGREQIALAIRQKYSDTISKVRADTIAKTEANRAYNRAQFEADRQFLAQNGLTGTAYKKWVTRSGHPCPYCRQLAEQAPIPFTQNFADVGDTLSASFTLADGGISVRQMPVTFEDISNGNAHPNCQCTYKLIIE